VEAITTTIAICRATKTNSVRIRLGHKLQFRARILKGKLRPKPNCQPKLPIGNILRLIAA